MTWDDSLADYRAGRISYQKLQEDRAFYYGIHYKQAMAFKRRGPDAPFKAPRRSSKYRATAPGVVPGFTRRTGFYGRFGPAGTRGSAPGELKFFDTTKAFTASSATGVILNNSLNLIPQGVTESERVGRKCTIRGLYIKGIMKLLNAGTAATVSETYRLIVYLDKQANGAAATVTDILESADVNSFRNLANSQRFVILSDQVDNISATAGAGNGTTDNFAEVQKAIGCAKPKLNVPIEFSSTTGALTEIKSNNIGVLIIGETGTNTNIEYIARVRFSDG